LMDFLIQFPHFFLFFFFVFQILRLSAREENVRKMITIPSERAR
jgi:hypothetical protein